MNKMCSVFHECVFMKTSSELKNMLLFALVKRTYKSWLNCELAMENAPSKASKVLKIMDSILSVSKSALISS